MSEICHIHGVGPSIKNFKPDGSYVIGCNDSMRHHYCDDLIVVSRLDSNRAGIVRVSRPKRLLSFMSQWRDHPCFHKIPDLHHWKTYKEEAYHSGMIRHGYLFCSNNTPFIACSLAYNLGYKKIILWGVDFTNHPLIQGYALEKTKQDFEQLNKAISKNGASLYLGSSGSVLDLPLWN